MAGPVPVMSPLLGLPLSGAVEKRAGRFPSGMGSLAFSEGFKPTTAAFRSLELGGREGTAGLFPTQTALLASDVGEPMLITGAGSFGTNGVETDASLGSRDGGGMKG